ncbi:hypothetical protein GGX14DRAFT_391150 [Mycena pura]|uniref:Uncharacterized protein n=1 Tax=Mycena pura TaxID=153505 RepID=A0AAD6VL35_9AGAR|nr:hypothetical protein GGX14DRAFT_391150 [Mycena pura]
MNRPYNLKFVHLTAQRHNRYSPSSQTSWIISNVVLGGGSAHVVCAGGHSSGCSVAPGLCWLRRSVRWAAVYGVCIGSDAGACIFIFCNGGARCACRSGRLRMCINGGGGTRWRALCSQERPAHCASWRWRRWWWSAVAQIVSMSSVWLIRELFGWGHWTWRWGNSQRCEKVDYQDWSPQPRGAPSMVINRRYTIKESIQLKASWRINEGSCVEYHVMASGTRAHGVEDRIQVDG